MVQPVRFHYNGLAEVLMSSSHLLTLYMLALKESQNQSAYSDVLNTLVQCLEAVKPKSVNLIGVIMFVLYKNLTQQIKY